MVYPAGKMIEISTGFIGFVGAPLPEESS